MAMNKQNGNMYGWVTHTWNVVRGKCPHDCSYCYMKMDRFKLKDIRFAGEEMKTKLGAGNTIFVGSSCDMWAADVPGQWIEDVLGKCRTSDNTYIFQSKAPARFDDYRAAMPARTMLGMTIETNRHYKEHMGNAPAPSERVVPVDFVSIEPIMDFDMGIFMEWMNAIHPSFVSVGADSKAHGLPEPPADKITQLIKELSAMTEVKLKPNLKRLMKER